jgi:serine/threonine-protein kinase
MVVLSPLTPGFVLENRYEIIQVLGSGGFGRTYLAHDRNRFNERCVLKEFAPQVNETVALHKAIELFQREASILYQLNHPQIPTFRELLRVSRAQSSSLFLVEQYIEGQPYSLWLQQEQRLSEAEVLRLLLDLLPVLTYIHDRHVIHRDISPDNLIYDQATGKPVLIDFGSVKQAAITAIQSAGASFVPTQVHKLGYTPQEQLRGKAYPSSDLYALAVTTLVLLTGQPPWDLYNEHEQTWEWRRLIRLHPQLGDVLDRLLTTNPFDRYQSAREVERALQPISHLAQGIVSPAIAAVPNLQPNAAAVPTPTSALKTWVVSPERGATAFSAVAQAAATVMRVARQQRPQVQRGIGRSLRWLLQLPFRLARIGLALLQGSIRTVAWLMGRIVQVAVVLALAGLAIAAFNWRSQWLSTSNPTTRTTQACRSIDKIVARYEALGRPKHELYAEVDRRLYDKYPKLKGRPLTNRAQDAALRQEWCQIAATVLESAAKGNRLNLVGS